MKVLVTGAAGYFGGAILPALAAADGVSAIVATDLRAPAFQHPKLTFVRRDLATEGLDDLLGEVDAAIHLAFVVERRPGQDFEHLNGAAARAFLTAAAARLDVVVVASSVMAYGLHDAPFDRLREDDPPAPGRGFYYAEHKLALERFLDGLEAKARVVRARPCVVGGPAMPSYRAEPYRGPLFLTARTPHPQRFQMLHEQDLASAFVALLDAPAGAYNLAPHDEITTEDAARLLGQRHVAVPLGLAALYLDWAWRFGKSAIDGSWARSLAYQTHVVDNAKLRGLGWAPRFTTRETLREVRGS